MDTWGPNISVLIFQVISYDKVTITKSQASSVHINRFHCSYMIDTV